MKIIEAFTPEVNFWEVCPQLTSAGPTKKLYDSDKTKNKTQSSKLMWSIAFIWDLTSKFYSLPEKGKDSKIDIVFTDVYGDATYPEKNIDQIEELKYFYIQLQDSPAKRTLREIEAKLEERARFLNNTKYDLGTPTDKGGWVGNTASIVDKMLADTKKIYDLYEAAVKAVEKENQGEERNRGGGQSSLTDTNTI